MRLNVAYACNEAYMEQTTVSIISLFENNAIFDDIYIYLIDLGVSEDSKKNLYQLVGSYKRKLQIISFCDIAYDLKIKDTGRHIQSVYAKLFFGRIYGIDRILYLDSDIVVSDSLDSLWNLDLSDYVCAGVETLHTTKDNELMGMTCEERAINDGVVLMNLAAWRKGCYLEKSMSYIELNDGNPPVLSEGVINNICRGKIKIIHPRYNLMSGIVNEKQKRLEKLTGRKYYSQEELDYASRKPCIIHYLSGFYNRPWSLGCTHPLKKYYFYYRDMSVYKDVPLNDNSLPMKLRIVGGLYRFLPITLFNFIRFIFAYKDK